VETSVRVRHRRADEVAPDLGSQSKTSDEPHFHEYISNSPGKMASTLFPPARARQTSSARKFPAKNSALFRPIERRISALPRRTRERGGMKGRGNAVDLRRVFTRCLADEIKPRLPANACKHVHEVHVSTRVSRNRRTMLPRAVRFTLKAPRLQKRIRHSENIGGLFPSRYDANGARYSRDGARVSRVNTSARFKSSRRK